MYIREVGKKSERTKALSCLCLHGQDAHNHYEESLNEKAQDERV